MTGVPEPTAGPTPEEIMARLREVARDDLELTPDQIAALSPDQSLGDGLALDSLRQVILVTRIEDIYGFEFEPDDQARLAGLRTLGDLVGLVAERAGGRPA